MGLKAYLLIRIGMDVDEGQWFGRGLGPRPVPRPRQNLAEAVLIHAAAAVHVLRKLCHLQADMPEWTDQSAGNPKDSRPAEVVGRHGLASALQGRQNLLHPGIPLPAGLGSFRRMAFPSPAGLRSFRQSAFPSPAGLEAEWGEELSAFVEDFYTEYGLAIELRLLEDGAALKRLRLFCGEPVIVVDFTGESYMAVPAVPEGSRNGAVMPGAPPPGKTPAAPRTAAHSPGILPGEGTCATGQAESPASGYPPPVLP